MKASIAIADDHVQYRNGMANLLKELDYDVLFEAGNGHLFLEKLKINPVPDIVLMDINMPVMDGYETTLYLIQHYPSIKILALSMYDDEISVIRMIRNGARGYILKDCEPTELEEALKVLLQGGFYDFELVTGKLEHTINHFNDQGNSFFKM